MLYVGEGDPIRTRQGSHYLQKDFWTRAIGFTTTTTTTGGQLNKAHLQFLESRLIALNGVLAMQGALYQFTQDYTFSAPSTPAAAAPMGGCNGRLRTGAR